MEPRRRRGSGAHDRDGNRERSGPTMRAREEGGMVGEDVVHADAADGETAAARRQRRKRHTGAANVSEGPQAPGGTSGETTANVV
jgi:hypothetical protein